MIGEKIKRLRMAKGMGTHTLAEKAGIGRATIVRIEEGAVDPHLSTLERIARALGVGLADLIAGREVAVEAPPDGEAVFAWAGVDPAPGGWFVSVWEPGREFGRVYLVEAGLPKEAAERAVAYDLEEAEAEGVRRLPFLRRWGAGPVGLTPPPERLFAAIAEGSGLRWVESLQAWREKGPPLARLLGS